MKKFILATLVCTFTVVGALPAMTFSWNQKCEPTEEELASLPITDVRDVAPEELHTLLSPKSAYDCEPTILQFPAGVVLPIHIRIGGNAINVTTGDAPLIVTIQDTFYVSVSCKGMFFSSNLITWHEAADFFSGSVTADAAPTATFLELFITGHINFK